MGKDADFKNNIKIQGFVDITNTVEPKGVYNPDKVFGKDKTIIVLESSSTGDRKVHIGEMTQFLSYVLPNPKWEKCYYVLFLCGNSTEENELKRLQSIYDAYPISKTNKNKIVAICIQDQPSNEELRELTIEKIEKFKKLSL